MKDVFETSQRFYEEFQDYDLKINEIPGLIELSDLTKISISEKVDNSLCENGESDIITHPVSEQQNGLTLEDEDNATGKTNKDNGAEKEFDVLPDKDEQTIVIGSEISESGHRFSGEQDVEIPVSSAPPKELDGVIELSDLAKISISEKVDNSLCENGESDNIKHPVSEQQNGLTLENEENATGKSNKDNGAEKEFDVLPDKDEQTIVIGSEISESGHRFSGEQDVEIPVSSAPPKELDELLDLAKISISEKVDNSLCENGESDNIKHPVSEQQNGLTLENEENATGKSNKDNGAEKEFDVLPDKDEQTIVIGSEISESGHRFPGEQDVEIPVSSAPQKELDDDLIINEIPGVIELSDLAKISISEKVDNSLCENGESDNIKHPVSEQQNGLTLEDEDNATGKTNKDNGAEKEFDVLPDKDEQTIVIGSEISESGHRFSGEQDVEIPVSSAPPKELDELLDLAKISISEKVDNSLCENGESDNIKHPVSEQQNGLTLEDEDNATGKTNKDNGAEKEFDVLPDKDEQTIVIGSEISESGHRFSGEQDVEIPVSSAPPKELDGVIELSDLANISISEKVDNSLCENGESDNIKHPVSEQQNGLTLEDEDNATGKSNKDNGAEKEFDVLPDKDEQTIVIGSEISESGHRFSGEQDVEIPVSSAPPKELDDDLKINEIPSLIELSDLTKISISEKVDNSLCENGESDIITHPVSEQQNGLTLEDEDNATGKTNKDNGAEKEFDVLPDKDEQTIVIGSEISESGHRFPGEQDVEIPVSSAPQKELDDDLIINEIPGVIELSDLAKISISEKVDNSLCENGESDNIKHPVSEQQHGLTLEDEDNATAKTNKNNGAEKEFDVLPDKDEQTIVIGSEISESGHRFSGEQDVEIPVSSAPPKELDGVIELSELTKRSISEIVDNSLSENGDFDIVTHPVSEQHNEPQKNLEHEDNATGKTNKDNGAEKEFDVLPDKDEQNIVIGSEISESKHRFPDDPTSNTMSNLTKRSVTGIDDNALSENGERPNGLQINFKDDDTSAVQYRPDVNTGLILHESSAVVGSAGDPGIFLLSDAGASNHEVVSSQEQLNSSPLKDVTSITEKELVSNTQKEAIEELCIQKNSSVVHNYECKTKNQILSDDCNNKEISDSLTNEAIALEPFSEIKQENVSPKTSTSDEDDYRFFERTSQH
ncbi:uncharacterized protein LOC113565708 [Drosophila persimilis]|uniref:uncharacterized protein LOC113565708 n=1 Tax=Drosophila persimilis TaxID=7234 RepID=UPI000F07BA58|nr:uncharacterized protein LOC113565708 [Drosophila persimilis]